MKALRKFLIFFTWFIGIGAICGMLMMFIDPTGVKWGMDPLLKMLQVMPFPEIFFTNFIFSGIVLFLVNGATQIFTAITWHRHSRRAPLYTIICGIILMGWCILEWVIFYFNFLTNLYFAFGVIETLAAITYIHLDKRQRNKLFVE